MGTVDEVRPAETRPQVAQQTAYAQQAAAALRGGAGAMPPAATGPIGAAVNSLAAAWSTAVNNQAGTAEQSTAKTAAATERGLQLWERTDADNAARFKRIDPEQSLEAQARKRAGELTSNDPATQAGQTTAQVAAGVVQGVGQAASQVGQQFQQVGQQLSQSAGQIAQQGSQLMSKVTGQDTADLEDGASPDAGPETADDPGVGLGGDPGLSLGSGGAGSLVDPSAASPTGAAVAPFTSTAYAGGAGPRGTGLNVAPVSASSGTGTPMGGAPMIPPRGGIGGASSAANKKNEDDDLKPLLDPDALPYVDQQLGITPTIDTDDDGPSFSTEAMK